MEGYDNVVVEKIHTEMQVVLWVWLHDAVGVVKSGCGHAVAVDVATVDV